MNILINIDVGQIAYQLTAKIGDEPLQDTVWYKAVLHGENPKNLSRELPFTELPTLWQEIILDIGVQELNGKEISIAPDIIRIDGNSWRDTRELV
jgi:hypothetical protein